MEYHNIQSSKRIRRQYYHERMRFMFVVGLFMLPVEEVTLAFSPMGRYEQGIHCNSYPNGIRTEILPLLHNKHASIIRLSFKRNSLSDFDSPDSNDTVLQTRKKEDAASSKNRLSDNQLTTTTKSKNDLRRVNVGKRIVNSDTVSIPPGSAGERNKGATTILQKSIDTTAKRQNTDEDKLLSGSTISQSDIYSAIDDLLRKHSPQEFMPVWDDKILSDAIANFGRTIGILGETTQNIISTIQERPGNIISETIQYNDIVVRIATPNDDVDIANLRLSVFSDFSPDMHNQFCFRSCQAIAARRLRGAVCVVATTTQTNRACVEGSQPHLVLGTAECSFHEFVGTRLGDSRLTNSILYITEVAVNPSARRRGIGTKLLSAIDVYARKKGIESLYLHVDVKNNGALNMYHKAGYREVDSNHPMYYEFTKSLNLHPGATKGRDHVLLCSNLTSKVNWCEGKRQRRHELVGSLGFEIPA
jgi:ribosomal protein S18 acetylase RimI-like enzyme